MIDPLNIFDFPGNADYLTSDKLVREALYYAYDGKCFYTRGVLNTDNFVIDHVIPRSRGGPDNIFNYVITSKVTNSKKIDKYDHMAAAAILSIVRTIYAPKALSYIQTIICDKNRVKLIKKECTNDLYYFNESAFNELKGWFEQMSKYMLGIWIDSTTDRSYFLWRNTNNIGKIDIPSTIFYKGTNSLDKFFVTYTYTNKDKYIIVEFNENFGRHKSQGFSSVSLDNAINYIDNIMINSGHIHQSLAKKASKQIKDNRRKILNIINEKINNETVFNQ